MSAHRPLTVSFSGLDGAGKSHQIDALVGALSDSHSVEVVWLPLQIWPMGLLQRLPARLRSRLGPQRRDGVAPKVSQSAKRPAGAAARLLGLVWFVVGTLAAVSVGLSLRHRARRSGAEVMVLDRYRLDSVVKLQTWYAEVSGGWLTRIVATLANAPDVEFLLRVDPEVAYARKPEQFTVAQLARQARLYDELAQRPGVVTLDAHREPGALAHDVRSHVMACFDDR